MPVLQTARMVTFVKFIEQPGYAEPSRLFVAKAAD
jgi:hypothetical protein